MGERIKLVTAESFDGQELLVGRKRWERAWDEDGSGVLSMDAVRRMREKFSDPVEQERSRLAFERHIREMTAAVRVCQLALDRCPEVVEAFAGAVEANGGLVVCKAVADRLDETGCLEGAEVEYVR